MSIKEIFNDEKDEISTKKMSNKEESFFINSSSKDKEWRNLEQVPLTLPLKCKVPYDIVLLFRSLEINVEHKYQKGKLEFGAFLSGSWKNGFLEVENDVLFLKQNVTSAAIDFLEDPPKKYNGIIHRHPSGCNSFSGTDYGSINQNAEFSLLYVNNDIIIGIYNIMMRNGIRIQVPLKVEILYPVLDRNFDDIISNIIPINLDRELHKDFLPSIENRCVNHNPLFNLENDDDDDDDLDNFYQCPYCASYFYNLNFPYECNTCCEKIEEYEAIELNDIEVNPDMLNDLKKRLKNT